MPQMGGHGHWETEKADLLSAESKYPASKNKTSFAVASADLRKKQFYSKGERKR